MDSMKNLQVCLMKYFLLCSLSLLLIQGAPTVTDMKHDVPQTDFLSATEMKCEIRSSCSSSSRCQHTKPMTVDPGSNINLNCPIISGGLTQGMTWEEAKQAVQNSTRSSDLVLQQSGLTNSGKYSCRCTALNFTRALQIVWVTSSPSFIIEGRPNDLECFFSGWPLPREVYWYKDGKLITNGTEGIFHSEYKKSRKNISNGEVTFHSKLHLPPGREEQEGFYNCSATNSIPGWSSSDSFAIQMLYECPVAKGPNADSPVIPASISSNVSLSCWIDYDWNCPEYLFWHHLNDNPKPLPESGDKYNVEVRDTHSQCKKEFILSIFNVTKNDEGTYSCHWLCEYENTTKAAIDLKVVDDVQTGI